MADVKLSPQSMTGSWSNADTLSPSWSGSGADAGKTFAVTTNATGVGNTNYPQRAFDGSTAYGNNTIFQTSSTVGVPINITMQFGTAVTVNMFKLWDESSAYHSHEFTFDGSNNGSSWTTLRSVTGASGKTGTEYTISSPGAYTYYRYNITDAHDNTKFVTVIELELWGVYGLAGWAHTISGVSTPAYVCGVAGSAISKVMGV